MWKFASTSVCIYENGVWSKVKLNSFIKELAPSSCASIGLQLLKLIILQTMVLWMRKGYFSCLGNDVFKCVCNVRKVTKRTSKNLLILFSLVRLIINKV